MAEEGELSSPDELETSLDGVELNVLDDILGEPANDEFAAELDTPAKTSVPSRKRRATSGDKSDVSKKRHLDSPKLQTKENNSTSLQTLKISSQTLTKNSKASKTIASGSESPKTGDSDKVKLPMKEKEEKQRPRKDVPKESKVKLKEKDKTTGQLENENSSKEKGKEKDTTKNKQKDMKGSKNEGDSKTGDQEIKKKEEQNAAISETKEIVEKEKEMKKSENLTKKLMSSKAKDASKFVKKEGPRKEAGKKEAKKDIVKKTAENNKGQSKVSKEKVKPESEEKTSIASPAKKVAKHSVQSTPTETKSSKVQETSSNLSGKSSQKQINDGVKRNGKEGVETKSNLMQKKSATQTKLKKNKVSKSVKGKEQIQTIQTEQEELGNKVEVLDIIDEPIERMNKEEAKENEIAEFGPDDSPEAKQIIGVDAVDSEPLVESKTALAEETDTVSKYEATEDMEVIDDLEEASEDAGGSDDSGEEDFSEEEGGSVSPSSSGSSKSESENLSGKEQDEQEGKKVKRRKRKASSPVEGTKSSGESENSLGDSQLHIKSKVAKASSSKSKKTFNLDEFFEEARYFVMKSNNHENVALSKAKGVWSTPKANEKKLNAHFKRYKNVILIFSVKESGKFQGFARLASEAKHGGQPMPWVLPPGMSAKALGGVFKLEWLNRRELWFSKCLHLRNPWNDNKEVKICRDGQEVEPAVGEALCRLFPEDETVELNPAHHLSTERRRRKESDAARHRPRHSEELRKTKRKHRVSASRHHVRDHHEPSSRYEDRSRYGGVRRETLLHGSYSDYMREYQRSRHSSSLPPLRSHFSTRGVDVPSYYPPLHISHSSSRSGGYHRTVDPYAAACDEFLRRTQSDRGSSSRYRSRRR
ncbi:YTH domain-containing protein 1-like isoform X2 [Stylophora pistillata]|uniref:YTH domain-containing protein 1-like isoform X2 n=1 Tax=Stylophora pistillata TaxID=50429 RepID=UPI000C045A3D|nr:YTH domain-containing protein 1-like isoform X2 [Stylophora pistillata]